jgi:hypothetical protein
VATRGIEVAPKGLDGGGDAVDARKVHVRQHEDARRTDRHSASDAAILRLPSASPPPSSAPAATSVG